MGAPKGHAPYPGCEKGGKWGFLGKPDDAYTEEELHNLGKELVEWLSEEENFWFKSFLMLKGLHKDTLNYLSKKYPFFKNYLDIAKALQEYKLVHNSFWKKADFNTAKFVLLNNHDGWSSEPSDTTITINHINPCDTDNTTS